MDDLKKQLLETWDLNNRVTLKLLEALDARQLDAGMNSRARNVGQQLAHLHNVRIMWLEVSAPDLLKGLEKLGKDEKLTKAALKKALKASSDAMGDLLSLSMEKGKVKNSKLGVAPFLGYMLAHEGHHRGQILLHLKAADLPIEKQLSFDLWDWAKI